MKNTTIQLDELSIGYPTRKGEKLIAQSINAALNSKELTCILGENGVGKSTLLRTLTGFQAPLHGKVFVNGKRIKDYNHLEIARTISVVLTDKCDIRNMSARDLIEMGRSPYTGFWGRLSPEDTAIVDRAIALVGIQNLCGRMIHQLSDGERQKVMIAKALAQETPIVILDEPTAFLDFPSKVEIMKLLHRLSREMNKTIFLSTHDLELALQIADKIWLMDKTNGIAIGTPEDLALSGQLSNFFARKGILFDYTTGLFRVDNEYKKQIKLVGHGQKYAMVRKALERNGILANRSIVSDTVIYTGDLTDDGSYTINFGEKSSRIVSSIEELLEVLAEESIAIDELVYSKKASCEN